ncbi:hypothetical protein [Acidithiobacillus sulfuriphilus]|uniref:Uncharacterized protein n=1 Tax=Acidithiobacillus sulfuriphilus TaxID=1867749 RepID=A0ACD5HRE9_9PROT|nr:hypothetical protein [Acidithiobacillus sulfuriphilus]
MKKTGIRKKMATAILTTFPLISAIAYAGPLSMPSPLTFDAGPLGKLDVQGVASAFGFWQDNVPAITGFGGKKLVQISAMAWSSFKKVLANYSFMRKPVCLIIRLLGCLILPRRIQ